MCCTATPAARSGQSPTGPLAVSLYLAAAVAMIMLVFYLYRKLCRKSRPIILTSVEDILLDVLTFWLFLPQCCLTASYVPGTQHFPNSVMPSIDVDLNLGPVTF